MAHDHRTSREGAGVAKPAEGGRTGESGPAPARAATPPPLPRAVNAAGTAASIAAKLTPVPLPVQPPPIPAAASPVPAESAATQSPASKTALVKPAAQPAKQAAAKPAHSAPDDPASDENGDPASEKSASERRSARRRPAGPSRDRIAANDDAPSIGGLIFALQQKPSNTPFVYAAALSGIWAAVSMVASWFMLRPELAGSTFLELLAKPVLFSVVATVVGPILLFWFLALLAWRTEELKLRSSAMTEVAVRLAEPDRMAEQQIASLGQAVRRQVSFMNDAVGRAIGRAGELEAMVQSEVASLERAYEENERRIRGLISELAGERTSLLTTSSQISDTLRTLGTEVPTLIDGLANQQLRLTKLIEGAGQNLHALESALASQTGQLEEALGTRTAHLQGVLEDYTAALGAALGNRTQEMHTMFQGYMESLDGTIGGRTGELQGVLEEYARALDTTLATRAQALDMQLVERTRALDDAFADRLRLFDESVLRSTMAIDSTVSERAIALTGALETHARTISDSIGRQAGEFDQTLMSGIDAVRRTSENITRQSIRAIEGMAGQSELLRNISEGLLGQIREVTSRFENQGRNILQAAGALENVNSRIDLTLQARQADLAATLDRLSGKADDIGRLVHTTSSTLEGQFSEAEQRTRLLASELARAAEVRSQSVIADVERLKSVAEVQTQRSFDELRSRFTDISREMTDRLGTMSSEFAATSSEIRARAERTSGELELEHQRLRAQLDALPASGRESTEAMRRALQDQIRALEQLSTLTGREARRRDIAPPALPALPAPAAAPSGPPGAGRTLTSLSSSLVQELAQRQGRGGPGEGREGWKLGELLARASQEDEHGGGSPLAPLSAAGQALNLDVIARALDPATASAIWSRIRAGQRGIMVRSIYTAEGRSAFDEVSRRVRVDTEFQATVSRYLLDFEQIVRDADARDPGGRLTQSQIVSDTGRVYLFLAHAAGRLS